MTAPRSRPVSSSTTGKCAACRCASRSVPRMWKRARSPWPARGPDPGREGQVLRPAGRPGGSGRRPAGGHPEVPAGARHRLPRQSHLRPEGLRRTDRSRPERLGLLVLVRIRRVRGQGQGRHQSHHALHSHRPGRKLPASASCAGKMQDTRCISRKSY